MARKRLISLGVALGVVCPLGFSAFDPDLVALIGFAGMFVVGLILQTAVGLRAWRSNASCAAQVSRATLLYWAAASGGFTAGWAIAFTSLFGAEPPARLVLEQSVVGLPLLWIVAAVCGAVVVGVASAARAVAAR